MKNAILHAHTLRTQACSMHACHPGRKHQKTAKFSENKNKAASHFTEAVDEKDVNSRTYLLQNTIATRIHIVHARNAIALTSKGTHTNKIGHLHAHNSRNLVAKRADSEDSFIRSN
jgi:hypothetical protein